MDFNVFLVFGLVMLQNGFSQKIDRNFWQTSSPGKLLKRLDSMTLNDIISSKSTTTEVVPTTTTSESVARRRHTTLKPYPEKIANKRIIVSEDNSGASASVEADDYERKYEQFVHNYFDDAADHYLSDENSQSAEVSNLSADVSSETDSTEPLDAVPYASKHKFAKNSKKNCRKERRKREVCFICKNPRNGERSETCSFERSTEPESFAYETQRKYRKTRDRDVSDSEEDNDESGSSKEQTSESKIKIKALKPKNSFNATAPNSSCIKRNFNGKSCYYCKDAIGTKAIKCFDLIPIPKPGSEQKQQKRRIYKRTLSYFYEKGIGSNGTLTSPEELNSGLNISSKLIKRNL